jgi:F-type H+-transporting ATPase subunit alpha
MKKVAGTLKLLYSQYRELQNFAQFGSDLDADTKSRLAQGERIVEILKQDKTAPVSVGCQIAIIYAAVNDLMAGIPIEDVKSYEKELYTHMEIHHPELLSRFAEGYYEDEDKDALDRAVRDFTHKFTAERHY